MKEQKSENLKPWEDSIEAQVKFFEDYMLRHTGISIEEASYSTLLKHPLWKEKRKEVLAARPDRCESCGETFPSYHIHHKKYLYDDNGKMFKPWEYDIKHLKILCKRCHSIVHGMQTNEEKLDEKISNFENEDDGLRDLIVKTINSLRILYATDLHPMIMRICLSGNSFRLDNYNLRCNVRHSRKRLSISEEMINRCLSVHGNPLVSFSEGSIVINHTPRPAKKKKSIPN